MLHLLLVHEHGEPLAPEALDARTAAEEARPIDLPPMCLCSVTANPNDLSEQRWAVVIPDNPTGERLCSLVAPLIHKRAEDQRDDVTIVRVPPGMDAHAAANWKREVFPSHHDHYRTGQRPVYLCILGDMDQVSLATQRVLADGRAPGRLVCADESGYEAYTDKVLRWESQPAQERPRSLFYTAHDGTPAIRAGYETLMRPCFEACQTDWREERRAYPASRIEEAGDETDPDPGEFLDLAGRDEPTVLFSLSNGLGPPRERPWSPHEARARQGAVSFGPEGALLGADIADAPFLPGGIWVHRSAFGAGTPDASAYHHWLRTLAASGTPGLGNLEVLLAYLDSQGGFTSGLAQAALANGNGPLAMIGLADLAWSRDSRESPGPDRDNGDPMTIPSRGYQGILASLIRGERLGASMLMMQQMALRYAMELNALHDMCRRAGTDPAAATNQVRAALGNLWALRQEALGHVLLGDPAVRIPVSVPRKRHSRSERFGAGRRRP